MNDLFENKWMQQLRYALKTYEDKHPQPEPKPKKQWVWDEDEAVERAQEAFIRRCEPED